MMRTLYESILDDEDERLEDMDKQVEIENWITDTKNCWIPTLISSKFKYKIYKQNGQWYVDTPDGVQINKDIPDGLFTFNNVEWCDVCKGVSTLKGCALHVKQYYTCEDNKKLKTLEGGPIEADSFNCDNCINLVSLKGAPKEVNEFTARGCIKLKSLKGGPEIVNGEFSCEHCDSLKNLEGAPKVVTGRFNCSYCENLVSLKGCPKKIGETFTAESSSNLKEIKDGQDEVGGLFNIYHCNKIRDIENIPKCKNVCTELPL